MLNGLWMLDGLDRHNLFKSCDLEYKKENCYRSRLKWLSHFSSSLRMAELKYIFDKRGLEHPFLLSGIDIVLFLLFCVSELAFA